VTLSSTTAELSFRCSVCGGERVAETVARADGRTVAFCATCGMGALHPVPDDLLAIYLGDYYRASAGSTVGYADYETMAEHGVAWAGAIIQALGLGGAILDIGCANGQLLRKLCPPLQPFGIETNPQAAEQARSAGVTVIGADLLDGEMAARHTGDFDAVTSIATFEHLRDFRGGVANALAMLKKDGLLLFEVPLISADQNNATWYSSSLEHVFYPTVAAIEYLFRTSLAAPLLGRELCIAGYASTYIGIAAHDEAVLLRHRAPWERITDRNLEAANALERRARAFLHVIHAAHRDRASIEMLADLTDADMNRALIKRIAALWSQDAGS
jgi:SAM-dependent methyltransferase